MTDEHLNRLLKSFIETENSKLHNIIYDDYKIDLSCLSDLDKFCLIVLLYNKSEYGCTKKKIKKIVTGWTDCKIKKLAKESNVGIVTLFDDEGLLRGKGYMFNGENVNKFNKMFYEHIKTNNNGVSWYYSI